MTLAELTQFWKKDVAAHVWKVVLSSSGEPRTMATFTNGHFLVMKPAQEGDTLQLEELPSSGHWGLHGIMESMEDLLERRGRPVSRQQLMEFVGNATWRPTECTTCDGAGGFTRTCGHCDDDHQCTCPDCSAGLRFPKSVKGIVTRSDGKASLYFSRNYVALLLELFEGDSFRYAADDFLFVVSAPPLLATISRLNAVPDSRSTEPRLRTKVSP